jgi:hypothetical protein
VPFDESLGVRREVEVLVEAGMRLADLGISELDEEPLTIDMNSRDVTAATSLEG